jgi:SAM-dependent methyltransferase
MPPEQDDAAVRAEFYDRSINWAARIGREIPVLVDVLGPPGDAGILDAGCGTGRQALALAERGYRVVATDISKAMLEVAQRNAEAAGQDVAFVLCPFATLHEAVAHLTPPPQPGTRQPDATGFDGLYCLGNSLAASGSWHAAEEAIRQFSRCLRPGGRLFLQVVNFNRMRLEHPCVRGPRVTVVDGIEYVSVRQFHFAADSVEVTNITLWRDDAWRYSTHTRVLCPVSLEHLEAWCNDTGLRVDDVWGDYGRNPYAPDDSVDLLVTATRV